MVVLSHPQLHDSESSRNVYRTCKESPNDMADTPSAGWGQVLLKLTEVMQAPH